MANAIPTIIFLGTGYVPHQHSNIGQVNDPRVKVLDDLAGPELVSLHNLVRDNIDGKGRTKRFATRTAAVSRTWKALGEYAATDPAISPELARYLGVIQPAPKPVEDIVQQPSRAHRQGKPTPVVEVEVKPGDVAKKSDQLLAAAAAAGSVVQAQAALRNAPPASDNPAKDAEMPALRRTVKPLNLEPKTRIFPRRAGSKQAVLVDLLSREQGATFGELYDGLAATGKPWRGVTIRSGLAWDMNHIAGYGVAAELFNGEQFAEQGRTYEARRLGMLPPAAEGEDEPRWTPGDGYDPELRLAVYRLTYPKGQTSPVPHTPKKG